jgi:hypothetical protein
VSARPIGTQVSISTAEPSPAQARAWAALWRLLLADAKHDDAPAGGEPAEARNDGVLLARRCIGAAHEYSTT